jgi:hypothetical protein
VRALLVVELTVIEDQREVGRELLERMIFAERDVPPEGRRVRE